MSPSTKQCTALVRIICDEVNDPPRRADGQYVPHNIVDGARRESLIGLFRKHKVIKIEPCLHATGGEHIRDLYLATFPSERKMDAAIDAWDEADVEVTPYIEQLALDEIKQDSLVKLPVGNEDDNTTSREDTELKPTAVLTTQNNFEDWWATQDPENWAGHQTRLQHTTERNTSGVWVYEDKAGKDPTMFTYAPHPIIEYGALDREEYTEPLIATINWDATRDDERFNLGIPKIVRSEWLPLTAAYDAMSFLDESDDSEDVGSYRSTPESSAPGTPTSNSFDIFETFDNFDMSLQHLEESDLDMSSRGRNKIDRSHTLVEAVEQATLEEALQQLKGSPAESDKRSILPHIGHITDPSSRTATGENRLASSLNVSLDIFDEGASKLKRLEDSIFDLSPRQRNNIDTSRNLSEIFEQVSLHNALQKFKDSPAKAVRSAVPQITEFTDQLAHPVAAGSALISSLSLRPQDAMQAAHQQAGLSIAQVAATSTHPTHDSGSGIHEEHDDLFSGLSLNAGVATATGKLPSPAHTIGATCERAQATSDSPMQTKLDSAEQDTNTNSLPHRNITLPEDCLECWAPQPDLKLTKEIIDDMSLHTDKDGTVSDSPPQSPTLSPITEPLDSQIPEITMIAEAEVPVDHLENMWWKLLLLLIIDFLAMGLFSKAVAYPLECLVVALAFLHTGRNAEGGLIGWIWQEEVEQDQQLDVGYKEGGAMDGRVSPADSGICLNMMGND